MSSVGHGKGISDIALGTSHGQAAAKARSGDTNIYGLRIADMPTSSDLPSSSTSLISTPFSCPQAPPFEYPYPTPNDPLSVSPSSYAPSNVATFSFSLGFKNPDGQADSLRGKGFPIWMSLSKMKGINDTKPPIPPGLIQKAGVFKPSTSASLPEDPRPVSSMNPDHQHQL